jgi:hypothetical protein
MYKCVQHHGTAIHCNHTSQSSRSAPAAIYMPVKIHTHMYILDSGQKVCWLLLAVMNSSQPKQTKRALHDAAQFKLVRARSQEEHVSAQLTCWQPTPASAAHNYLYTQQHTHLERLWQRQQHSRSSICRTTQRCCHCCCCSCQPPCSSTIRPPCSSKPTWHRLRSFYLHICTRLTPAS